MHFSCSILGNYVKYKKKNVTLRLGQFFIFLWFKSKLSIFESREPMIKIQAILKSKMNFMSQDKSIDAMSSSATSSS